MFQPLSANIFWPFFAQHSSHNKCPSLNGRLLSCNLGQAPKTVSDQLVHGLTTPNPGLQVEHLRHVVSDVIVHRLVTYSSSRQFEHFWHGSLERFVENDCPEIHGRQCVSRLLLQGSSRPNPGGHMAQPLVSRVRREELTIWRLATCGAVDRVEETNQAIREIGNDTNRRTVYRVSHSPEQTIFITKLLQRRRCWKIVSTSLRSPCAPALLERLHGAMFLKRDWRGFDFHGRWSIKSRNYLYRLNKHPSSSRNEHTGEVAVSCVGVNMGHVALRSVMYTYSIWQNDDCMIKAKKLLPLTDSFYRMAALDH